MLLNLSEQTGEALHAQISRQVRARILARELGGGELLPSIRALAREYRVSIITVQRAYEDLEREGLLHSHPGKGFYVTEHPEQTTRTIATRRFAAAFADLVARTRAEGLDDEELGRVIREVLSGGGRP